MKPKEKQAVDRAISDVLINLNCAKNALNEKESSQHNISLCLCFLQTGIEKLIRAQNNLWEKQ